MHLFCVFIFLLHLQPTFLKYFAGVSVGILTNLFFGWKKSSASVVNSERNWSEESFRHWWIGPMICLKPSRNLSDLPPQVVRSLPNVIKKTDGSAHISYNSASLRIYSKILFYLVKKKSDKQGRKMNCFCDRLLHIEILRDSGRI